MVVRYVFEQSQGEEGNKAYCKEIDQQKVSREGFMNIQLSVIKPGLALVLIGLAFGIALGVGFGVDEDAFKNYIAAGVAAHPEVHGAGSEEKIWRYVQRAHFHSTGIAAFAIGLLLLVSASSMSQKLKKASSVL
ncbi:MAG: hypothetical protein ACC642_10125, partial [Pseudomonadales bacterium]